MGWLIAIWAFAAFCGWLVYSAYGPVLEIAATLAYQVAPELIGPISAIGQTPGIRTLLAVGTALVIGIGLSLVWLVIRALTGGAKRVASAGSRGQPVPASRSQRTDWQLDERDGSLARPSTTSPTEPEPTRTEPTPDRLAPRTDRPRDPFDPANSAPQWGRQAKTDRDR